MISFVVACYNCENFLRASVASALAQRDVEVEVLIIDDCSTDQSFEVAMSLAAEDSRVRCFRTPENGGPAKARNIGLREARGEWVAILDSDDVIKPSRSVDLINSAKLDGADLVADNLIVFSNGSVDNGILFIKNPDFISNSLVTLELYISYTIMYTDEPNLGFLKPIFKRTFLLEHSLYYNENLIIGEDDDLILRCLIARAKYSFVSEAYYCYRKHSQSISHRLSAHHADLMLASATDFEPKMRLQTPSVRKAWKKRYDSIAWAAAFAHMIEAIKNKKFGDLIRLSVSNPQALLLFRQPIMARLRRLSGPRPTSAV